MKLLTHWQFRWTYLFCLLLTIACVGYWFFYRTGDSGLETAGAAVVTLLISRLILQGTRIALAVEAGRRGKISAFAVRRQIASSSK